MQTISSQHLPTSSNHSATSPWLRPAFWWSHFHFAGKFQVTQVVMDWLRLEGAQGAPPWWNAPSASSGNRCAGGRGKSSLVWRYLSTPNTDTQIQPVQPTFFCKRSGVEDFAKCLGDGFVHSDGKKGWTELYWPAVLATQGTCARGAECTWAHGEEDRGVRVPRSPEVQIG